MQTITYFKVCSNVRMNVGLGKLKSETTKLNSLLQAILCCNRRCFSVSILLFSSFPKGNHGLNTDHFIPINL
jgi:hypothetical protein